MYDDDYIPFEGSGPTRTRKLSPKELAILVAHFERTKAKIAARRAVKASGPEIAG